MQNNKEGFKLLWSSDPHYGQTYFELNTKKDNGYYKKMWKQYLNNPDNFYLRDLWTGNYFNHEDSIKIIHCRMCTALQINNYERYCSKCKYFPNYSKIDKKIKNNEYKWEK